MLNCGATQIERTSPGFRVEGSACSVAADVVIVATPAFLAGRLLEGLDPQLAEMLSRIRYHSSLLVSFGFDCKELPELEGFGFVVPRSEGRRLVACTWVTNKFEGRSAPESMLVRCFFGGARDPKILEESDARVIEIARAELASMAGIQAKPKLTRVHRWPHCMPQYGLGHLELLEQIQAGLRKQPGVYLAGNGYRGIGIPDCIQSASAAAESIVKYLRASSEKGTASSPLGQAGFDVVR